MVIYAVRFIFSGLTETFYFNDDPTKKNVIEAIGESGVNDRFHSTIKQAVEICDWCRCILDGYGIIRLEDGEDAGFVDILISTIRVKEI